MSWITKHCSTTKYQFLYSSAATQTLNCYKTLSTNIQQQNYYSYIHYYFQTDQLKCNLFWINYEIKLKKTDDAVYTLDLLSLPLLCLSGCQPVVHPSDKVTSGKNEVTVLRNSFASTTALFPLGPGRMSALTQTGRRKCCFTCSRSSKEGCTASRLYQNTWERWVTSLWVKTRKVQNI